jgi:outer membrane immunogenic protein
MKKFALALTALAAFTGSAVAADLPPAPAYSKAPVVVAPAPSWTGFYIFGGAGGSVWDAKTGVLRDPAGNIVSSVTNKSGGDGFLGTAGAGYDWQVSQRWVFGIFGDAQFGGAKGSIGNLAIGGDVKLKDTWAGGARVGYLVAPNVLSYVNAGYTGSDWGGTTLTSLGVPAGAHTDKFSTQGWFIGGGVENNLDIFGISAPGWFMKTEYRAAYYDNKNVNIALDGVNTSVGSVSFKPLVETVSTSLVYRFNWTGTAVRY